MRRYTVLLVAAALLFVAVPAAGTSAGVYPVDNDHPLTEDDAVAEFEDSGTVSRDIPQLLMTVTVANKHDDANISGPYVDVNRLWVCMDYKEDVERTVRLNLPSEYLTPRPVHEKSVTSAHSVRTRVLENKRGTALTVAFDGPGRACFAFSKSAGTYFGFKSDAQEWLNRTAGFSLPKATASSDWQRLPGTAFENASTYPVETDGEPVTIQFDAEPGPERTWINVPKCADPSEQAVCRLAGTENETDQRVTLMSTQSDPPAVRYRMGESTSSSIISGFRDTLQSLGSAWTDFTGLFGGGGD